FNNAAVQTGTAADSKIRILGGLWLPDNDDSRQYAQIDHGGISANGNLGRDTDLTSVMAAGDIEILAGDGVDSNAQIGNGGYGARGDMRNNIQVFSGGSVSVAASQFSRTQTLGN